MKVTKTVFLSEQEIRDIIKDHLVFNGLKQIGDVEIIVRHPKDIPEGATAGDCIGVKAEVEEF